jgi:hypothetical protein
MIERGGNPPGGIEVITLYSFYLQEQVDSKDRAEEDLEALKAATLTSYLELCDQIHSESDRIDSVGNQMRTILLNLPQLDELLVKVDNYLHDR